MTGSTRIGDLLMHGLVQDPRQIFSLCLIGVGIPLEVVDLTRFFQAVKSALIRSHLASIIELEVHDVVLGKSAHTLAVIDGRRFHVAHQFRGNLHVFRVVDVRVGLELALLLELFDVMLIHPEIVLLHQDVFERGKNQLVFFQGSGRHSTNTLRMIGQGDFASNVQVVNIPTDLRVQASVGIPRNTGKIRRRRITLPALTLWELVRTVRLLDKPDTPIFFGDDVRHSDLHTRWLCLGRNPRRLSRNHTRGSMGPNHQVFTNKLHPVKLDALGILRYGLALDFEAPGPDFQGNLGVACSIFQDLPGSSRVRLQRLIYQGWGRIFDVDRLGEVQVVDSIVHSLGSHTHSRVRLSQFNGMLNLLSRDPRVRLDNVIDLGYFASGQLRNGRILRVMNRLAFQPAHPVRHSFARTIDRRNGDVDAGTKPRPEHDVHERIGHRVILHLLPGVVGIHRLDDGRTSTAFNCTCTKASEYPCPDRRPFFSEEGEATEERHGTSHGYHGRRQVNGVNCPDHEHLRHGPSVLPAACARQDVVEVLPLLEARLNDLGRLLVDVFRERLHARRAIHLVRFLSRQTLGRDFLVLNLLAELRPIRVRNLAAPLLGFTEFDGALNELRWRVHDATHPASPVRELGGRTKQITRLSFELAVWFVWRRDEYAGRHQRLIFPTCTPSA